MTQSEKRYLYAEGNRLVAELDATGALVAQFVYAANGRVPDLMLKSGVLYRLLTDHLGSVRLVVNTSNGTAAQRVDYDTWGNATLVTGSWDVQPFGFAGGLSDPDTKLVHFGAREYDPEVGRWLTKDPSLFRGGMNLYAYSRQDPVNYIDSDGRAPRGATCPHGLDCEYNSHAAVQSKLGAYRQEWGPVSSFAWPITMLLLHKQFAKYDYWTEFGPEGQYEIEPGDWGHSGDLGNYVAGYGAAFGPPIAASGCAALAVHAAGGYYNGEPNKSGLFGDSKGSEERIMQGFRAGLAANVQHMFVPYWARPNP